MIVRILKSLKNTCVVFLSITLVFGCAEVYPGTAEITLSPPLFSNPPCSLVKDDSGKYEVEINDINRSYIEFLWFIVGEAIDRGMTEGEIRNLLNGFMDVTRSESLKCIFDIENLILKKDSLILPFKENNRAIRFFKEKDLHKFNHENVDKEQLGLSSGTIIRFSETIEGNTSDKVIAQNEEKELAEMKNALKYLWRRHNELWYDLSELNKALTAMCGMHSIKSDGEKLLMFSKTRRYVLKVNWEEDFGYEKEKNFFIRKEGLPISRLLFYNDRSKVLIFDNVTYENFDILLFDYLHNFVLGINDDERSITKVMRSFADVMSGIHSQNKEEKGEYGSMFRHQNRMSQIRRVQRRYDYLLKCGYGRFLSSIDRFRKAQERIEKEDIVVTHGDCSPWNCYLDVEKREISSMIDAETSSEESRYKDLAKVIISFVDAGKNSPAMIDNMYSMLEVFFDEYCMKTGINREQAFRVLPYYLASQLLWYAEETQRIMSVPVWVRWRLEMSKWALGLESFSLDKLKEFLLSEEHKLKPSHLGGLRISDLEYRHFAYSGQEISVAEGEKFNIRLEMDLEKDIKRAISAMQIGVEIWTDLGQQGAWYAIPAIQLKEIQGKKIIFEGQAVAVTPGTYKISARIRLPGKKEVIWSRNDNGDVQIKVTPRKRLKNSDPLWLRATNGVYNAVVMDYDGTIVDYDGNITNGLYDACCELIGKGVPVCINTSRTDPLPAIQFFEVLKNSMGSDFDPGLCFIQFGAKSYNVSTGKIEGEESMEIAERSIASVFDALEDSTVRPYMKNVHISENRSMIGFLFSGGARKDAFVRELNIWLSELNKTLPEEVVAEHADNFFQIKLKRFTKKYWLDKVALKWGIPVSKIARIGDQGQVFGVDRAILDSYGGFSVNHNTNNFAFPLNTAEYLGLYGSHGTEWLLKNLKFISPGERKGSHDSITDKRRKAAGGLPGAGISQSMSQQMFPRGYFKGMDPAEMIKALKSGMTKIMNEVQNKKNMPVFFNKGDMSLRPRGLILYADSIVEANAFFDLERTLKEGFFKENKVFNKGAIVLYGRKENREILEKIINKADPSINVIDLPNMPTSIESMEVELVSHRAKSIVLQTTGIEHDFVGIIRGKSDNAMDMVVTARNIDMPIILFNDEENGVYSFYLALIEAFLRKYKGDPDSWVCLLPPVTRLSDEQAKSFRVYMLEYRQIGTKA